MNVQMVGPVPLRGKQFSQLKSNKNMNVQMVKMFKFTSQLKWNMNMNVQMVNRVSPWGKQFSQLKWNKDMNVQMVKQEHES